MAARRVRTIFEHFGLVVSKYPTYWSPEYHIRRVLREHAIDLVLDVGAFRGDFGRELRRLGFTGQIISFEPVADSFDAVQAAASADQKWSVERLAMGDTEGTLTIHVHPDKPDLNSALRAGEIAQESWKIADSVTEEVPATTVDSWLQRSGVAGNRIFLKVDTQGLDMKVVAGAAASFHRITALQVELPIIHAYTGSPDFSSSVATIQDLGFALSNITPVARVGTKLVEVDCLFVRG